jgi:hypothetical protein
MLAWIVLLPIVPAFLLFKALPSSSASVSGPLERLKIKLGGAFAGYFSVLIVVIYTHAIWNPPPAFQVWDISGRLQDEKGAAIEVLDSGSISLTPPTFMTGPGGYFRIKIMTVPAQDGAPDYPVLNVRIPNFQTKMIRLEPLDAPDPDVLKRVKLNARTIAFDRIILREVLHNDPKREPVKPVAVNSDYSR